MYPRRKKRPQCNKCKHHLEGKCFQRKYKEYGCAELEGHTKQHCEFFEEGTEEDKKKLIKRLNRRGKGK